MSYRANPATYKPAPAMQKCKGRHAAICKAWARGLSSGAIAKLMRAKYKCPCSVGYVVNIAAQYGIKRGPTKVDMGNAARAFAALDAGAFR